MTRALFHFFVLCFYVRCGYATLHDVRDKSQEDRMESFFLSETCKYLYLVSAECNLSKIEYVDLARAKSEALVNILIIYSNKKLVKSCNAKRRWRENGKKSSLISNQKSC